MAPGLFALKDPDPNKNSAHPDPNLLSFKDLNSVQIRIKSYYGIISYCKVDFWLPEYMNFWKTLIINLG